MQSVGSGHHFSSSFANTHIERTSASFSHISAMLKQECEFSFVGCFHTVPIDLFLECVSCHNFGVCGVGEVCY